MSVISASKKLLRKDIMSKLHSLAYHVIVDQSLESLNVLKDSEIFKRSKSVGIFMSMDTEIKTQLIIKESFDAGKDVYLPHISKIQDPSVILHKEPPYYLIFYKMENYESCLNLPARGKYKLREPTSGPNLLKDSPLDSSGLDLLIMPGVAFTKKLDRLGHGGAFYDDFIKRHDEKFGKKPYLLGIGLEPQLVEELPTESHDEPLDGLIIRDQFYTK